MIHPAQAFADSDIDGEQVGRWVEQQLPPLEDLLTVKIHYHSGVPVWHTEVPPGTRDAVVWRCAVALAANRLKHWPRTFAHWFCQLTSLGPADMTEVDRKTVTLLKNIGTPGAEQPDTHLCGLVAETVLGELLAKTNRGLGDPVLFEGHDYSVTDPGGDVLLIFETAPGPLGFQLWESKAVTGLTRTSTTVVNEAAEQLATRGAEYLARYKTIASQGDVPDNVRKFALDLVDLWFDDDDAKHVGVSVARESAGCTNGSFAKLPEITSMPAAKTQGSYSATDVGLLDLAREVRDLIWKGCGLV